MAKIHLATYATFGIRSDSIRNNHRKEHFWYSQINTFQVYWRVFYSRIVPLSIRFHLMWSNNILLASTRKVFRRNNHLWLIKIPTTIIFSEYPEYISSGLELIFMIITVLRSRTVTFTFYFRLKYAVTRCRRNTDWNFLIKKPQ